MFEKEPVIGKILVSKIPLRREGFSGDISNIAGKVLEVVAVAEGDGARLCLLPDKSAEIVVEQCDIVRYMDV